MWILSFFTQPTAQETHNLDDGNNGNKQPLLSGVRNFESVPNFFLHNELANDFFRSHLYI